MNDEFLYRLRAQPSWKFASSLKTKLDMQTATADAAASKRRYLYLVAAFLIGGTALAFISPRVRSLVAVATDSFGDASTAPEPTNAVATTPNTDTRARPIRPTNATIRQIPALKAERPSTTTSLVTYSTSSIDNTDATTR